MRTADDIPPQVRELQRAVASPDASAWVAANAGSGKTQVLAQRVIDLLLDGVAPEKILCITFTKAAAANMAEPRVRHAGRLDDSRRCRARQGDPRGLGRAQRCTAAHARRGGCSPRALETPGGLKVQTIHAFCTQLLHQFPFEANVAARFTVLDETQQRQTSRAIDAARPARWRPRAGQRSWPRARGCDDHRRRSDVSRRRPFRDQPPRCRNAMGGKGRRRARRHRRAVSRARA